MVNELTRLRTFAATLDLPFPSTTKEWELPDALDAAIDDFNNRFYRRKTQWQQPTTQAEETAATEGATSQFSLETTAYFSRLAPSEAATQRDVMAGKLETVRVKLRKMGLPVPERFEIDTWIAVVTELFRHWVILNIALKPFEADDAEGPPEEEGDSSPLQFGGDDIIEDHAAKAKVAEIIALLKTLGVELPDDFDPADGVDQLLAAVQTKVRAKQAASVKRAAILLHIG